jgi:sulfatase modifying factor 1
VRLRSILVLSLCSGCNALTGASELEPVGCTIDCPDTSPAVDSMMFESTAPDSEPQDVGTTDSATGEVEVEVGDGGCPTRMVEITGGMTMTRYCIDTRETTNVEYKAWLDKSPSTLGQPAYCSWNTSFVPTSGWPVLAGRAFHPVRYVDWCDALAYCKAQGKRLCGKIGGGPSTGLDIFNTSTNEWLRACTVAGTRAYPYGNTFDLDYCNAKGSGYGTTVTVGSLTNCTNPYATFDMSGNVSEWDDSCSGMTGGSDGCRSRGGSYGTDDPRCAVGEVWVRQTTNEWIGIRCCSD